MERNIYVLGNWKLNKSFNDLAGFFHTFNEQLRNDPTLNNSPIIYGFAPSYVSIQPAQTLKQGKTEILSQDVCGVGFGAYTGQIAAKQLLDYQVKYCIVGHSETRKYLFVTDQMVRTKTKSLLENGMVPVICVGESLSQYEGKQTYSVLENQLKIIFKTIDKDNASKCVIAYEPLWAIGSGKTPTMVEIENTCSSIRHMLASMYDETIANKISILYGGSVKPENTKDIISNPDVDGLLIGGASLDPNQFFSILKTVEQWKK